MKANVAQLRRTEGGTQLFTFQEAFPPFKVGNDEFVFVEPLDVRLKVSNSGQSLVVDGHVQTKMKVACSRCLKPFSYDLSFDFEDEWISTEISSPEDENALLFEKEEVPLDDRILEHVVVQLPMRFICSEECQGLCPHCGNDRNVKPCACSDEVTDPRLEILSKWNKGV